MKPLGTITMCFPHVDEETKSVLQSIMEEAENYADFTERLAKLVLSETVSPLLEYLAVFFLFRIRNYQLIEKLEDARKVPSMAEPLLLAIWAQRGQRVGWEEMRTSLLSAINDTPNDWIATQLYLNWRLWIEHIYTETDVDVKPIEIIISNVNSNEELECFKSNLFVLEAYVLRRERKRSDGLILLREALTIARKFDDQVMVAEIQVVIVTRIKHTDLKSAIDLLNTTKELCVQLGYSVLIGTILFELGHIMTFRGEIYAGIDYHIECNSIRESLDLPTEFGKSLIAFFYNQIGDGERALEFAKKGLESTFTLQRRSAYPFIQFAWTLINLDRCDEAKVEFAIAQELALKSGEFTQLTNCRIVEGILDKTENNLGAAIACFEEVLRSIEDNPTPVYENICLLNLTEIEIEMLDEDTLEGRTDLSGPWMQKLFEHSKTKDLPGIAARAKILQASLLQKQKRYDDMRKLLNDVRNIADQYPSMSYLNGIINATFPDLITK